MEVKVEKYRKMQGKKGRNFREIKKYHLILKEIQVIRYTH